MVASTAVVLLLAPSALTGISHGFGELKMAKEEVEELMSRMVSGREIRPKEVDVVVVADCGPEITKVS